MRKLTSILLLTVLLLTMITVPAYADGDTATLIGDGVNLRSGPGLNYEVLGSFPEGEEVLIIDRSNPEWYAVMIEGHRGFIHSSYLRLDGEGTTEIVEIEEPDPEPTPAP